jgi:hypothetical protein
MARHQWTQLTGATRGSCGRLQTKAEIEAQAEAAGAPAPAVKRLGKIEMVYSTVAGTLIPKADRDAFQPLMAGGIKRQPTLADVAGFHRPGPSGCLDSLQREYAQREREGWR